LKRNVRDTSIEAYLDLRDSGRAETQKDKILMLFRFSREPMTNREMAFALGMEPSTVSARRNELIEEGKMKMAGKRKCKITGITAYTWTVTG